MAVKGLFMFGFDKDTPDCFDKTLEAIKDWNIEQPFYSRLNKLKKSNPQEY